MISTLRTQAACLDSVALDGLDDEQKMMAEVRMAWAMVKHQRLMIAAIDKALDWQRAKACVDQRAAMHINDDMLLDILDRLEYDARLSARNALTAAGIDVGMLGELA